jgi:hypothetical protein
MTKSLSFFLLAALTAALFLIGCGGGSNSQLSKAEFIKQGNAICQKSSKKRTAEFSAQAEDLSTEQIVMKITLPSMREIAERLDELGAPEGDEERIEAIVTGIEDGVDKSEQQIKKDPEGFETYVAPAERQAVEYGLKDCVEIL